MNACTDISILDGGGAGGVRGRTSEVIDLKEGLKFKIFLGGMLPQGARHCCMQPPLHPHIHFYKVNETLRYIY